MYRNKSFQERLRDELQDPESAREYLLACMEGTGDNDELGVEDALRQVIKHMGIKEFCEITKVQMPNIIDFLNGRRNPKPETLNVYLKPFGLKIKLTVERIGRAS